MSLTKLSLAGKKLNYSCPGRVWSVTSRLGTGKRLTLFYSVSSNLVHLWLFLLFVLIVAVFASWLEKERGCGWSQMIAKSMALFRYIPLTLYSCTVPLQQCFIQSRKKNLFLFIEKLIVQYAVYRYFSNFTICLLQGWRRSYIWE